MNWDFMQWYCAVLGAITWYVILFNERAEDTSGWIGKMLGGTLITLPYLRVWGVL